MENTTHCDVASENITYISFPWPDTLYSHGVAPMMMMMMFLAVQNSSIGDLVTQSLTKDFTNCHTKNNPIDFRPPRHLIRVMRRHVLTNKKTETKTKTNTTKTPFENLRF